MERLPDLLVLDFCEWLQQSILRKAKYDSIDMWDLLFDDKYANVLERKSEEYCEQRIRQSEDWSNTVVRDMYAARRRRKSVRGKFQFGKLCIGQQFQLLNAVCQGQRSADGFFHFGA